jgi:glycosyltransferase involved in cell wall biosynthesis
MTVHEYPPFYNGIGAMVLHCRTKIPYSIEIHHLVGEPHASSWSEWIGSMMNKVFLRFDAWCARKVRVVNGTVRKQLMRRGIPEDKITLVPSFYLDAQKLTPDATIAKSFDLVTACRLVKNKNIDALLDVLVNLPMLRLLIIGDGPERAALEIRARKISLSSRITFAGWLPTADDVYRAMQRGRVFVMPSRSEGGPRALLEAIALKLPVVTTDVGIAPDIVALTHGRFTTGTSADLTQKIDDILAHPPHDSDLAEASVRIFAMYERTKAIKAYADFLS